MEWIVKFHDDFEPEFDKLSHKIRAKILGYAQLLEQFGPSLGRPHADTLKGSRFVNMKELRFSAGDGVWRVAYAFDPVRRAILLVAGDKTRANQKRFYQQLIQIADARFLAHLKQLDKESE